MLAKPKLTIPEGGLFGLRQEQDTPLNQEGNVSPDDSGNDNNSPDDSGNNDNDNSGGNDNNNSNDNNRNVSGNNSGNIIISKIARKEEPKRVSYYLKPSTIRKIERLASNADMYISEFLQKMLDEVLEKIEIK